MSTLAIPTEYGREWNARAAAGEAVSPIVEMRFGDGTRAPDGSETGLENEVHKTTFANQGISSDGLSAFFDGPLPKGVGGFVIREVGLFTADGNMVAVGTRDPGVPISDVDDLTYRFEVFFDRLEALTVELDPIHGLTEDRLPDVLPWASQTEFADAETTGRIAEVAQIHSLVDEKVGGIEFPQDMVRTDEEIQDIVAAFLNASGASIVYDDAGNALSIEIPEATESVRGIVERATDAEADSGSDTSRYVTPKQLWTALNSHVLDNLDDIDRNISFRFNNHAVGAPETGYNYDAVGWSIVGTGQRTQFISASHRDLFLVRIDDGSGWEDWHKLVFQSDLVGVDQAWQSVTRDHGADYQNTTSKPITIIVCVQGDNGANCDVWVGPTASDYLSISSVSTGSGDRISTATVLIPPGHFYRVYYATHTSGGADGVEYKHIRELR